MQKQDREVYTNWANLNMKITNKRAYHNFFISEKVESGIRLSGSEVKSIKNGRLKLDFAFVKIIGGEAYLMNAEIPQYPFSKEKNYDPKLSRKLLLHKKEILSLKIKMEQNRLTIVSTACYTKHGFVKLELALAKGKRERDRRDEIKKRDLKKQVERELRGKM